MRLSLEWGYNWDAFLPSDIHMQGDGYNLTFHNVVAHDRPGIVRAADLVNTVAQYDARAAFYWGNNDKFSVSFGIDHQKYVALNGQTVTVDGWIAERKSAAHAGSYDKTPVRIGMDGDIINNFEHTNGLNVVDAEFNYGHELYKTKGGEFRLSLRAGAGAGMVIPKTDVTMFGKRLDNVFHVAGFSLSAAAGVRADFWNRVFLEARIKGNVIDLPDILTIDGGKASQWIGSMQAHVTLGVYFPEFQKKR